MEHNITRAAGTQRRSGSFRGSWGITNTRISQGSTTIKAPPETEIDANMAEDPTVVERRSDSPPPLPNTSKRKSNGEMLDTDPTGQPSAASPLLRLPRELRDAIYSDVLTLRGNSVRKRRSKYRSNHRNNIDGSAHTSILRTCCQVWEEASPFLYSNEMTIDLHGEHVCYGAESWSDPITEDEDYCGDPPLSGWPSFPAYFYKCKSFKIYFKIVTYTEFEPEFAFESDFNEEGALRTVMNLNSVVYTILLKLQSLQSIHFVLSIQNEPTDEKARLSNDFMLSLECECLATLWRLQGLKKAKLEGFHFQDPDYVAEIEQQMLQPRSQNWSGLSADYNSASTALAISNLNRNRRR